MIVYAECLCEERVLAGLSATFEPGLELALACRDDEHRDVRLGGAGDHVRDVRLVPRGVQDGEPGLGGLEGRAPDLDRLALGLFLTLVSMM